MTPLVAALRGKHFEVAEQLHRQGADVNVRDGSKRTPLWAICLFGVEDPDILQWLLNHGADVNVQDIPWTPLHSAAYYGHAQTIRTLIEHNPDANSRNHRGATPLHLAASPPMTASISHDHVDIMQVLLDYGADPNAQDNDRSTPLHHSSWWEKSGYEQGKGTVEGTRLLLKHGAIIDAEDIEGRTPLQVALKHGRHDIVACLMEHGAMR